jgi:hypothetical protein
MSRNVFHFVNYFLTRYKNLNDNNFIYVPVIGSLTCCHIAYVVSSEKTKNILITDKYTFTQNGHTNFMLLDNKGNHYNMNNSLWYWKWDSIEDWTKIQINKQINIKYYGYRIPEFGVFPNVVSYKDSYSD